MTVRHIILTGQNWVNERHTYLDASGRDLKSILSTPEKATAAIRMILATKILTQFRAIDAQTVEVGETERASPRKGGLEMNEGQSVLHVAHVQGRRPIGQVE